MYFVAFLLTLKLLDREALTIADSTYAHAAILKIISEVDPAVGRALHDMQRHKHFALAIVESQRGIALLRISFMAQEALSYAHLAISALAKNGMLQIGRTLCMVSHITIENGPWTGVNTWADITAPSPGRRFHFRFATPTAISKRDNQNTRYFCLLPDPTDIFIGLARRWSALDGPPLPEDLPDFLRSGGCVVSNLNIQTNEFKTSERTQIGFVSSVAYMYRGLSELHLEALQALTRLAFFTGVGYQTARGMGLAQTSIA